MGAPASGLALVPGFQAFLWTRLLRAEPGASLLRAGRGRAGRTPPGPGFCRCWWECGGCGSPLRATRAGQSAGICLFVSAARTRVRGLRLSLFLNLSQGKGLLADVTKAMALLPPKISTRCTLFPGFIVILTSRRASSLKSWPSVRDPTYHVTVPARYPRCPRP